MNEKEKALSNKSDISYSTADVGGITVVIDHFVRHTSNWKLPALSEHDRSLPCFIPTYYSFITQN